VPRAQLPSGPNRHDQKRDPDERQYDPVEPTLEVNWTHPPHRTDGPTIKDLANLC